MTQDDEKQRQDPIPVAERITEEREERGWSVQKLANKCAEVGAPQLNRNVLVNLQTGKRRFLSTDELIALALAFDMSPGRLLLPTEPVRTSVPLEAQHPDGWPVKLTEKVSVPWEVAQRWMHGESTISGGIEGRAEFIARNRPYEKPLLGEVQRFLASRGADRPYLITAYAPERGAFVMGMYAGDAADQINDELQRGRVDRRQAPADEDAELWPA